VHQVSDSLKLLATARTQAPRLIRGYQLQLEIWERCASPPPATELAIMAEGIAAFPRSAELTFRTARLYLSNGRAKEARALVAQAVRLGASDAYSVKLLELHQLLSSPELTVAQ
jgi:hypothetical protein